MLNKIYEKIKEFLKNNYKFLIFMIVLVFMFYYELPFVIYKCGGTIDLENRVIIDKEYKEDGKLSMSYVTAMKGTPAFILLSFVIPDWDLFPLEEITNEDSYDDVIKAGKEYLNEGIDNAIIAAFNKSNYGIEITQSINKVMYLSDKAKTDIEIGDEIVSIDDKEVTSLDELKAYVNTLEENDKVKVLVKHDNDKLERYAYVYYEKEDDSLKIGVAFKTTFKYKTEIPVSVKMKDNESGSSGGLMMSLAIYNALTEEDITKGLNIVGTGSIAADGTVEEIGGVKYKVLAANKKNADIFFCPVENYQEAMAVKKKRNLKIDIVKVHTLDDAINYLEKI